MPPRDVPDLAKLCQQTEMTREQLGTVNMTFALGILISCEKMLISCSYLEVKKKTEFPDEATQK